jgi:ubiquinone/menaquinone biosynthesis C-methylase UbiE
MNKTDKRKEYWNKEYFEYWKSRTKEAELNVKKSNIIRGDSVTSNNSVYTSLFRINKFNIGNLIDVGCGWGRLFPHFISQGIDVFGVDISGSMIEESRELWKTEKKVKRLIECTAEDIPFESNYFDNLVCVATFDATYQSLALSEFLRVTKPGGMIYISGKNYSYCDDDKEAFAAEIGASNKNHPNYFTRTKYMLDIIKGLEHTIVNEYYFKYRGDMSRLEYSNKIPNQFYEYFIVIKKGNHNLYQDIPKISNNHSLNFKESK